MGKEEKPWLLQLISILICLFFAALTFILFSMCKDGAELLALLVFSSISTIIWGIYIISSFMAISGTQPVDGGINVRLLISISDTMSKSDKKKENGKWSYYSHIEAKAKFALTAFLTIAVFSYALHWSVSIVLIICSFIIYFYVKRKSK